MCIASVCAADHNKQVAGLAGGNFWDLPAKVYITGLPIQKSGVTVPSRIGNTL